MRPHRLRLRAFGPFVDEVEVDLDALAAGGLFLLHGETGAGKTTLLDGLGFALFGRVPGARGKAGRLRSDAADPGVRTEVELEVTLSGRRWRITRSPAQERPKTRGTGTTTEQARVHLQEQRDGGWHSVSTRLDEAGAELDRLVGMSAEQFFQVVLLPQGEFARFLRADSTERGVLLQRLFATERFSAVEDWLAARRVATASAVAAVRQELAVLHARVAQAADVPLPDEPGLPWAQHLVDGSDAEAGAAAAALQVAEQRRDAARARAAEQRRVAELQQRRASLQESAQALAAGEAARSQLRSEVAAATRATELQGVLTDLTERAAALAAAEQQHAAARAALPAAGLALDGSADELRAAAREADRRAGRLEQLRTVAEDLQAAERRAGEAEREGEQVAAELAALIAERAALPARQAAAREPLAAARLAAAALPAARSARDRLTGLLADARALAAAEAAAGQLREELLLGRETWVSLRAKENDLREARLVTMLAELADRLEDGAPCEVCGSTDHPDPYEGAGEGVTRDDEDRARLASEQAARVVADLDARLAAETARAEAARERLGDADPAGLPAELDAAMAELARLEQGAATVEAAEQVLADLLARDSALAEQTATATGRCAALTAAAEREAETVRQLTGRLAGELDGAPGLDAALAAATARSAAATAALAAGEAEDRAAAERDRAERATADAADRAGFADVAAAVAAVRDVRWRDEAEQQLRRDDDLLAATTAGLADPELAGLPGEPVDLTGVTAALAEADATAQAAAAAQQAAASRSAALQVLLPEVSERTEALGPLEETASLTRRVADLCAGAGSNALRMRLTAFVLAARLEEVAAAASARLLRMTQGRYALRHTDGAAKGGARSGLGLLACDSWTGQDRETSTLSGGETFLASLALALGLADVVQAEAGGTRIDALFVDEGFGTLDEDTLDEVMDVLDGLREGGRVVGVVSHVAELRARIPAQVRVRKHREGSTLQVLGC